MEKKESPKRERAVKPVISLPSKNGTEDWVLKGTKLITNTKKQRLKSRVEFGISEIQY